MSMSHSTSITRRVKKDPLGTAQSGIRPTTEGTTSGGAREHRVEVLEQNLRMSGLTLRTSRSTLTVAMVHRLMLDGVEVARLLMVLLVLATSEKWFFSPETEVESPPE